MLAFFGATTSAGCTASPPPGNADSTVSSLILLLKDPNPDLRRTAALSLGKIASAEASPVLVQALGDRDPLVRQYSAWALGNLEPADEKAAASLMELFDDPDPAVANAAALAIGKIGRSPLTIDRLIEALQGSHPRSRRAAVQALAWLETDRAYPALVKALKDSDAGVRQGAIAALGELGNDQAVPLFQERLLHDPDPGVRGEAAFRLGKVGGRSARTALQRVARDDAHESVKRWAQWALTQMDGIGEPE
jgi:HEAT repeat protein